MAVPLDGIWARAPYLHNGSVPTLYALLTGDRPAKFQRGNIDVRPGKVGFVGRRRPVRAELRHDASGNSNIGHDTPEFIGDVDWKTEPKKLRDLLEYLKTL